MFWCLTEIDHAHAHVLILLGSGLTFLINISMNVLYEVHNRIFWHVLYLIATVPHCYYTPEMKLQLHEQVGIHLCSSLILQVENTS